MAKRTIQRDPELLAHQQWLGYLQPVGLVVAPAAMQEAGWVVTRSGSELIERQERYRESLEALGSDEEADPEDRKLGFSSIETLLVDHLSWSSDQIQSAPNLIEAYTRELPELGETLQPTALVPAATGDGAELLVQELPLLTALDQKVTGGEHFWRASAQERFERLLRETGVEAGLLFNGSQLRMVVAPKGESSGHITFLLKDLAEVSGRLMFSGLDLLLGQSHVFLDPDGYRLADVLRKSRSFQAVVSNALADQVLAALWELLRGFQQADELTQRQGGLLLGDLAENEPKQLYGGLITVLMRLVFLLYAEDNALLPKDAVYEQNYKVSGVFERLEQDAAEFPDTMEQRYGAWAGLMSLCQLVFAGGGATVDYLPARKGQLFDPAVYPWLETPWISDGVVHEVLSNLLVVKGERISYRALDVEQIGSVYEGIMGYAVRRIPGRFIGLKSKPQGAKKQLTTAVDLDALLSLPGGKRKAWLEEQAGTTLPAKSENALKAAASEAELLEALEPRINHELFDGPQAAGGLVFQPTEERRRSGSHYTPRALTRPIVEEALRPWLERCGGKPTVAQIMALKICDPAMGSGAFLVECCRYLAELLEQAWAREKLPDALQPGGSAHGEEPLIYARRLIAQRCIYGVDKNPFAVNLARLSLWLVSLSKQAPFTFVDHALQCGDSLVGMERSEIEKALKGASLQRDLQISYLDQIRQQEASSYALFHSDSRSDADDAKKRQALDDLNASTAYLRTVGDLLVAAFFNGKKPKDRDELKQLYLEATLQHSSAEELEEELAEPLERLRTGEKGIQPLHWQLAFPDVFGSEQPGFDAFVGNPPFVGGKNISGSFGKGYLEYIKDRSMASAGQADLVCYFFQQCFRLLCNAGCFGLIATSTISEGDSRKASLSVIAENGGEIFSAIKRRKWPGVAAVVIGTVFIVKGPYSGARYLGKKRVDSINPFLVESPVSNEPMALGRSGGLAFKGKEPYGKGFYFSDKDEDANSIQEMKAILQASSKYNDVIHPCIGGDEILSDPTQSPYRYLIDFGDMAESDARQYAAVFEICATKVADERQKKSADVARWPYWKHWRPRSEMASKLATLNEYMFHAFTSTYVVFSFVDTAIVPLSPHVAVASEGRDLFSILTSNVHSLWVEVLSSTMGSTLRYTASDCFETFPFPDFILCARPLNESSAFRQSLQVVGEHLHQFRAELMATNNEGLTNTYNRFHDPSETSSGLLELRRLHDEMDKTVLNAYGWADVSTSCGFALNYLDVEDDAQVPDEQQERIDNSDLFFWEADEACAFEAQLRAYGALKGKKKLPWRFRWPDVIRDDVLARLLALNAARHADEQAAGGMAKTGRLKSARSTQARIEPRRHTDSTHVDTVHIQTDLQL